jgi:branched-chain amino acid transport system ATP-binding protein
VPQGRELFPDMSVLENLELGALARKLTIDEIQRGFDEVFLMFPRLKERTRQQAGTLSGGEQQMLAMGRALMSQPQILLMDEPTSGLAPLVVRELVGVIRRLGEAGQTILLVEQNIRMALDVAEQVYLISGGRIAKTATADELRQDDNLFKAYMG